MRANHDNPMDRERPTPAGWMAVAALWLLAIALLLLGCAAPAAAAPAAAPATAEPALIYDLDTTTRAPRPGPEDVRTPRQFTAFGRRAVFLVDRREPVRQELWTTDGTPAGTRRLTAMCPDAACTGGLQLSVATSSYALFFVADGNGSFWLWRTDGTEAGTFRLTPGAGQISSGRPLVLGQTVLLSMCSGGCGLWRTDGTVAGTRRFADPAIDGGAAGRVGGAVLFVSYGSHGAALWRTDGTSRGTRQLEGFENSWMHDFATTGRRAFFMAGGEGGELWTSDGSGAGTVRLGRYAECSERWGCGTRFLGVIGDVLFFSSSGSLYRSDGTVDGTWALGTGPTGTAVVSGDRLVYQVQGTTGSVLMVVRAGDRKPRPVTGCSGECPRFTRPALVTDGGGRALVVTTDAAGRVQLWTSDGTGAGTRSLGTHGEPDVTLGWVNAYPVPGAGRAFLGLSTSAGATLWTTDFTAAGTRQVGDLSGGPVQSYYYAPLDVAVGGGLAFFAGFDPRDGLQPWASDGSAAGTRELAVVQIAGAGSQPHDFTGIVVGGRDRVAFRACDGERSGLWSSDGLPGQAPQLLLAERESCAAPGRGWLAEGKLLGVGGRLYFSLPDAATGPGVRQLWTSDGTAGGTRPLTSFVDRQAGDPFLLGDRVVVVVQPLAAGPAALWTTDGTPAGTAEAMAFPAELSDLQAIAPLGAEVYFAARHRTAGLHFFVSDGTAAGTRRITSHSPEELATNYVGFPFVVPRFTRLGDQVFFALCGQYPSPCGLWSTRGTLESTRLVVDDGNAAWALGSSFVVLGGRLLFFSYPRLMSTDGMTVTALGRVPIDFYGDPEMTVVGDRLFFIGLEGQESELWTSDGTRGGTHRLADLVPGKLGSSPRWLTAWQGELWFSAAVGDQGRELWHVGTAPDAVPQPAGDIAPGILASSPQELTALPAGLLFSADDGVSGREPWIVTAP